MRTAADEAKSRANAESLRPPHTSTRRVVVESLNCIIVRHQIAVVVEALDFHHQDGIVREWLRHHIEVGNPRGAVAPASERLRREGDLDSAASEFLRWCVRR